MDKVNSNMIMEIISKGIISKIRREEKENTILIKDGFFNLNSILILHRYLKYI
jgi:hypothetical protein